MSSTQSVAQQPVCTIFGLTHNPGELNRGTLVLVSVCLSLDSIDQSMKSESTWEQPLLAVSSRLTRQTLNYSSVSGF